jgi:hypothetical protein
MNLLAKINTAAAQFNQSMAELNHELKKHNNMLRQQNEFLRAVEAEGHTPSQFWVEQFQLWNKGVRDHRIHDFTILALSQ